MKPPIRCHTDRPSGWADGVFCGAWLGGLAALVVAGIVGIALDAWRVRNHERLVREAAATVDARLGIAAERLAQCDRYLRLASGQSLADVVALDERIGAR